MSNWVPDEDGVGCSVCHNLFSMTRRRHHCRKCGALVCGTCSDNFVVLPGVDAVSPVRICDPCELKEAEAEHVAEEIDVTEQIASSLRSSLREKATEIELYKAFLAHIQVSTLDEAILHAHTLCAQLGDVSEQYSVLTMDIAELERELRQAAKKCLKAEAIAGEESQVSARVEYFSQQIGSQDRLILQLQERLERLADSSSGRRAASSPSPRSQSPNRRDRTAVTVISEEQSSRPIGFCEILKALTRV